MATPATAIIVPSMAPIVIRSLKTILEIGIRNTGVNDISVVAIPNLAYLIATNENHTPTKGPKNAPVENDKTAFLSL